MSPQEASQSAGNLTELYRVAKSEHQDLSIPEKATLVAALGGLGFEWGTGNEALLSFVGANMYEITSSPALTGVATGAVSFAEQSVIGTLMAVTIYNFPKVADAVREMTRKGDETADKETSKISRFGAVMVLGSAVELVKENARRPKTKSENIRRAIGNSAIIATANTALIGGVAAVANIAADNGLESQTDSVINVVSSPLTYIGLLAGYLGYQNIKKRRESSRYTAKHTFKKEVV